MKSLHKAIGIILIIIIPSCKEKPGPPILSTTAVSEISPTSAVSGGNVIDDGGATIISQGICWDTSDNPKIENSKTSDNLGSSSFSSTLIQLSPNTSYYVRAYAANSVGLGYGETLSFKTLGQASTVKVQAATNLQYSFATINGSVNPNNSFTTVSFEWGTSTSYGNIITPIQSPVSGDSSVNVSAGLAGLNAGTTYHFRIKATNESGITLSDDLTFTTLSSVTDFDGNTYKVKTFGSQIWMIENLKTTHYSDGSAVIYGLYYPNNIISNVDKFGYLYDWSAALKQPPKYDTIMFDLQGQKVQGVCPTSWHLPSETEWLELIDQYGGKSVAALKLKIGNPGYWLEPLNIQEPLSGFNAIPGGNRRLDGSYGAVSSYATYWTTTQWSTGGGTTMGRMVDMNYLGANIYIGYLIANNLPGSYGLSVRCIKD